MSSKFFKSGEITWEQVSEGVRRKILGYDKDIMMVLVDFSKNSTGALHKHTHSQSSYVLSGVFEVSIDGDTEILQEGDCFVVPQNKIHGVFCRQAGALLDVFSPAREDFLIPKPETPRLS